MTATALLAWVACRSSQGSGPNPVPHRAHFHFRHAPHPMTPTHLTPHLTVAVAYSLSIQLRRARRIVSVYLIPSRLAPLTGFALTPISSTIAARKCRSLRHTQMHLGSGANAVPQPPAPLPGPCLPPHAPSPRPPPGSHPVPTLADWKATGKLPELSDPPPHATYARTAFATPPVPAFLVCNCVCDLVSPQPHRYAPPAPRRFAGAAACGWRPGRRARRGRRGWRPARCGPPPPCASATRPWRTPAVKRQMNNGLMAAKCTSCGGWASTWHLAYRYSCGDMRQVTGVSMMGEWNSCWWVRMVTACAFGRELEGSCAVMMSLRRHCGCHLTHCGQRCNLWPSGRRATAERQPETVGPRRAGLAGKRKDGNDLGRRGPGRA